MTDVVPLVQARLGSSRFPSKCLADVNNFPVITRVFQRVGECLSFDHAPVLVTSMLRVDDALEKWAKKEMKVECFRGSETDVLDRFHNAIQKKYLDCTHIVRICGDCPCIDPTIVDHIVAVCVHGDYDYVATLGTDTSPSTDMTFIEEYPVPNGLDVEVFTREALESAWMNATHPLEREHVTLHMVKNKTFRCKWIGFPYPEIGKMIRLTVDYPIDLCVVDQLWKEMRENGILNFRLHDIYELYQTKPEIFAKNRNVDSGKEARGHILDSNQGYVSKGLAGKRHHQLPSPSFTTRERTSIGQGKCNSPVPSIIINSRTIGKGYPTYIVAEISCNHACSRAGVWGPSGQSYHRCAALIRAAAAAGVDAVKLQMYTPDTITMDCDSNCFQIKDAKVTSWNGETLYSLYQKNFTPWEWFSSLQSLAHELNVDFFASPFDESAVDELEKLNVPVYKIASFESTDHGLLRKVARTGKPVIMSTGMASMEDIKESVQVLRAAGCTELVLLRCTSAYPATPFDARLSSIPEMTKLWNVPTGLSDHTLGSEVALAAVALGACIVEKHIIMDRTFPTADAPFSLTPVEWKKMVESIRIVEAAVGGDWGREVESENIGKQWRRSIVACKDIKQGETFIKDKNVRSIRPNHGLHTRYWGRVEGTVARRDIKKGEGLKLEDINLL
eukprot:g1724.t1